MNLFLFFCHWSIKCWSWKLWNWTLRSLFSNLISLNAKNFSCQILIQPGVFYIELSFSTLWSREALFSFSPFIGSIIFIKDLICLEELPNISEISEKLWENKGDVFLEIIFHTNFKFFISTEISLFSYLSQRQKRCILSHRQKRWRYKTLSVLWTMTLRFTAVNAFPDESLFQENKVRFPKWRKHPSTW